MLSFKYIEDNFSLEPDIRESMLRLRYSIFIEKLKWDVGVTIENGMEFDEYDNDNAKYIVALDSNNKVHATCRLIPTNCNYMLADKYREAITFCKEPRTNTIYEISRFCISDEVREITNGKAMGMTLAEAMRIGLKLQLTHFISLTTHTVIPAIRRYSAWEPKFLGPLTKTGNDFSYALMFDINESSLNMTISKSYS